MAWHNDLGKIGERLACEYLIKQGYIVRETNWRLGKLEIDIVAEKDCRLVIVEVKTRANREFADPSETITTDKVSYLIRAAKAYMGLNPHFNEVQFDVITIIGDNPESMEIDHLPDAFTPPLRTYGRGRR